MKAISVKIKYEIKRLDRAYKIEGNVFRCTVALGNFVSMLFFLSEREKCVCEREMEEQRVK